ncbi:hypothetical protein PtA15_5A794 [Puccinia triticina]|uniref:Uncharacterized protein n=1 Tax=Puccinia triticina TaxID=208348 RepID=A0ABY7CN48_9BASI|nr:uncharacterized protein PtA15_5A794 [Puccinia triticina]WAQ85220.1 hypothetical protein PtA15_5A794 [Puccinia triticina]
MDTHIPTSRDLESIQLQILHLQSCLAENRERLEIVERAAVDKVALLEISIEHDIRKICERLHAQHTVDIEDFVNGKLFNCEDRLLNNLIQHLEGMINDFGNCTRTSAMDPGDSTRASAMDPGDSTRTSAMESGDSTRASAVDPGDSTRASAMDPGDSTRASAMDPGNSTPASAIDPTNSTRASPIDPGNSTRFSNGTVIGNHSSLVDNAGVTSSTLPDPSLNDIEVTSITTTTNQHRDCHYVRLVSRILGAIGINNEAQKKSIEHMLHQQQLHIIKAIREYQKDLNTGSSETSSALDA